MDVAIKLDPDIVALEALDRGERSVHPAPFGIILDEHDPGALLELQISLCREGFLVELALHIRFELMRLARKVSQARLIDAEGVGVVRGEHNMGFARLHGGAA